jgi:fused signal recognition particle receptor
MLRNITFFACLLAFSSLIFNAYLHLTANTIQAPLIQNFLTEPLVLLNNWLLPYFWGCLLLTLLLLASIAARSPPHRYQTLTTVLIIIVLMSLQIYAGVWGILTTGMPLAISLERLLGLINFWLLFRLYLCNHSAFILQNNRASVNYFAYTAMLLLFIQIFLGIWSNANSTSLLCTDFPRCNGEWLPQADFTQAINIFYGVLNHSVGRLSFEAQLAAHWLHRTGGFISFIVLVGLMLKATAAEQPKPIRKAGLFLSILLLIELSLGTFSIKLGLPLWIMIAHHGFAALLMLPLIAIGFYSGDTVVESQPTVTNNTEVIDAIDTLLIEKEAKTTKDNLYLRLTSQLKKTRYGLGSVLTQLPLGQPQLTDEVIDKIEAQLLLADIGIEVTTDIINRLTEKLTPNQSQNTEILLATLKHHLVTILAPCEQPLSIPKQDAPFVILVIGVNGAGKTTTIGKLAQKLQHQGHSVMLAAGDTFRAAAVEQLQVWGERNHIPVIAQQTGADSASVIFDGLQSAQAKGIDVLIADTAGRLHTKANLMQELAKINRIIGKLDHNAPHEVLLVLDAGTGQNALSQAKLFNETVSITGLTLTKLDGTAKGGIIFALAKQLQIPIRHIGIGEGIEDLQDFNAEQFVQALFSNHH